MIQIKNILILLILLIGFDNIAFSQYIRFRKTIGSIGYDFGMSAQQTNDKGYIIGGSTTSFGNGSTDIYLIKTDSMGIAKWHQTYGGINIDRGMSIKQTNDNGYIISGYTNSYGAGGYDAYLIKTDSIGNKQWEKTYGGNDWDFVNCVEQTDDGGYILCGSTYSFGKGNQDFYLLKTNPSGDTLWTRTYGGVKDDEAKSVIQTTDGGFLLTGYTKSMGDTLGDFYTVKTNALGDTLWTNKFGGIEIDYGNDVLESANGGYFIGGETKSFGAGNSDGIIVKISNTGISGTTILIGGANFDNIESIVEASDGKIAMVGTTFSLGNANGVGDVYFLILNSNLSFYNSNTYGSLESDIGYSIEETNDRGFIMCGITKGYNSNSLEDIYLIKTDTLGNTTTSVGVVVTNVENINSLDPESIALYPNPADQTVHLIINSSIEDELLLTITDIIGRKHFYKEIKTTINKGTINIDIPTSDLKNGMYFINIQNKNLNRTEPFIVNH